MVEQINNYPEECRRLNLERYERLEQRRNRTEGRYWCNSYFDLAKTIQLTFLYIEDVGLSKVNGY